MRRLKTAAGFVLWRIGDPETWPRRIEMIGREIASRYARADVAA